MTKIGIKMNCAWCGDLFITRCGVAKYCTPQCYKARSLLRTKEWYAGEKMAKPLIKCKQCGLEMERGPVRKTYCSDACRSDYYRSKKKVDMEKNQTCLNCKCLFKKVCFNQKACSAYCRQQYNTNKKNAGWVGKSEKNVIENPPSKDAHKVAYSFFRKGRINGLTNLKVCRG